MKRILAVFSLIGLLAVSGQLLAVEYNIYSALIYVYDQDGHPLSGIPVSLFVKTWYGYEWDPDFYSCLETGTTNSYGSAYLECWIPTQYSEGLEFMKANMTDQDYTILSSENTFTTTAMQIYPVFHIVYDAADGDSLDDNLEFELAEKFSPVLHRHSWDKQQDLSNVDWILTGKATLKAYNILGQEAYSSTVSNPSQIHVYQQWHRDSFGSGDYWTYW